MEVKCPGSIACVCWTFNHRPVIYIEPEIEKSFLFMKDSGGFVNSTNLGSGRLHSRNTTYHEIQVNKKYSELRKLIPYNKRTSRDRWNSTIMHSIVNGNN